MGQQAACTLTFEGQRTQGTAWLEPKDLVFRGPVRLAIPLAKISSATARDGSLRVVFGKRRADFEIGAPAARWAARITKPPSRLDKLGVKPEVSVLFVGFADRQLAGELRERGARLVRQAPAGGVDTVFFGASTRAALSGLATAARHLKPNGALWIVRPKGSAAITEAETMAAGKRAGLVDVKVVSFSDTHTAEKFVIPVAKRPRAR